MAKNYNRSDYALNKYSASIVYSCPATGRALKRRRGPRKVVRLFGERRSNKASELFAFRRKRASGVCSDDVSRRNQWGHPGENRTGGGSPVELIAVSRKMRPFSVEGC